MTEEELKRIEDERHHSPTFVVEVRVPELITEIRRLQTKVEQLEEELWTS